MITSRFRKYYLRKYISENFVKHGLEPKSEIKLRAGEGSHKDLYFFVPNNFNSYFTCWGVGLTILNIARLFLVKYRYKMAQLVRMSSLKQRRSWQQSTRSKCMGVDCKAPVTIQRALYQTCSVHATQTQQRIHNAETRNLILTRKGR